MIRPINLTDNPTDIFLNGEGMSAVFHGTDIVWAKDFGDRYVHRPGWYVVTDSGRFYTAELWNKTKELYGEEMMNAQAVGIAVVVNQNTAFGISKSPIGYSGDGTEETKYSKPLTTIQIANPDRNDGYYYPGQQGRLPKKSELDAIRFSYYNSRTLNIADYSSTFDWFYIKKFLFGLGCKWTSLQGDYASQYHHFRNWCFWLADGDHVSGDTLLNQNISFALCSAFYSTTNPSFTYDGGTFTMSTANNTRLTKPLMYDASGSDEDVAEWKNYLRQANVMCTEVFDMGLNWPSPYNSPDDIPSEVNGGGGYRYVVDAGAPEYPLNKETTKFVYLYSFASDGSYTLVKTDGSIDDYTATNANGSSNSTLYALITIKRISIAGVVSYDVSESIWGGPSQFSLNPNTGNPQFSLGGTWDETTTFTRASWRSKELKNGVLKEVWNSNESIDLLNASYQDTYPGEEFPMEKYVNAANSMMSAIKSDLDAADWDKKEYGYSSTGNFKINEWLEDPNLMIWPFFNLPEGIIASDFSPVTETPVEPSGGDSGGDSGGELKPGDPGYIDFG